MNTLLYYQPSSVYFLCIFPVVFLWKQSRRMLPFLSPDSYWLKHSLAKIRAVFFSSPQQQNTTHLVRTKLCWKSCSGPEHFCIPQPLLWGDAEHVATSIQILYNKIKILQVRQNSDHTCSPYHSIKKKTGISCISYAGLSPVQIKSYMLNKIVIFFLIINTMQSHIHLHSIVTCPTIRQKQCTLLFSWKYRGFFILLIISSLWNNSTLNFHQKLDLEHMQISDINHTKSWRQFFI